MATIESICISQRKGMVKKPVAIANFMEGFGIENDAHGGKWHRQVSLLAAESIETVKQKLPSLKDGAFAENIITRGLDLSSVTVGDRITIGEEITLEITQIGKKCHNDGCVIKKTTGDCIMPREGIFAKVIKGGEARAGETIAFRR